VIAALLQGVEMHRGPGVRFIWKGELTRHDPDDRVRHAIDHHTLADHAGTSSEAVVPQAIAEDDDLGGADSIFILAKVAADLRCDAEGPKHRPRDMAAAYVIRAVTAREVEGRSRVHADVRERAVVCLPTSEVGVGHRIHVPSASGVRLADGDEMIGVPIGEGTQQHRADAAEDGCVDSDSQRETEHRGRGERRIADEGPDGKTEVIEHGRKPIRWVRPLRQRE
jgi:hypothetical protein